MQTLYRPPHLNRAIRWLPAALALGAVWMALAPVSRAEDGSAVGPAGRAAVAGQSSIPLQTAAPTMRPTEDPLNPRPKVCPALYTKAPASAIAAAVANASTVGGWGKPCSPNRPIGYWNPPRSWLSLHNWSKAYHPLFNPIEWRCGCG